MGLMPPKMPRQDFRFFIAINLFALGAIAFGLSSVAKTALFKRTLLEQQYEFEEIKPEISHW
jgi:hypothetical protein